MIKQIFLDLKCPLSQDVTAHGLGGKFHIGIPKAICFVSQSLRVQSIHRSIHTRYHMYILYILRRCHDLSGQNVVRNLVLHVFNNKFAYSPSKFRLLKLLGWLGLSTWNVRRSKIKWIKIKLGLGTGIFRSDTLVLYRKNYPKKFFISEPLQDQMQQGFFQLGIDSLEMIRVRNRPLLMEL